MKYFLVETETQNNPVPQFSNWFKQVDPRNICPERAGSIPNWLVLEITTGSDPAIPDILSSPAFMLSGLAHEVFQMYMPNMKYKKLVLLDSKTRESAFYSLPILPICNCLLPESEFNRDKSKVLHGVIDYAKIKEHPVFRLGDVTDTQIAIRLDVVESLLRRNAKGIRLTKLEIKR